MKYVYFISYVANHGNTIGYGEIDYKKIKSYDDLDCIAKAFEKKFDMKGVMILNYKLLRRKLW